MKQLKTIIYACDCIKLVTHLHKPHKLHQRHVKCPISFTMYVKFSFSVNFFEKLEYVFCYSIFTVYLHIFVEVKIIFADAIHHAAKVGH